MNLNIGNLRDSNRQRGDQTLLFVPVIGKNQKSSLGEELWHLFMTDHCAYQEAVVMNVVPLWGAFAFQVSQDFQLSSFIKQGLSGY